MKSIGFRCWGDKFSFVILEGSQASPTVLSNEHRKAPKGISRAEQLQWLRNEIHEILNRYEIEVAFYKAVEPISKQKDLERGQFEGVMLEAAFSHKKQIEIASRIKSQINRDTNSRKAKYVSEVLQNEHLKDLSTANFEEACLAALCGLPKN